MKVSIVIPARYESTRYPGKPLIDLCGKSMIQRVSEICFKVVGQENTYVATDSEKIENHCKEKGINVLMTSSSCLTGTDRVYEASKQIDSDLIINVQGDEPLLDPQDIEKIIERSKKSPDSIINGMAPIAEAEDFNSLTVPKVVATPNGKLLYMSRAPIPGNKAGEFKKGWRQICIYSFPKKALAEFYEKGEKTPLESLEDIEILRFLEMGYEVEMVELSDSTIAIDTPEDHQKVIKIIEGLEK